MFSMVRFQLMFSKISSLNTIFQNLSHGIAYFSVAQNLVDFVFFTCLRILGNYIDLRNREIWNGNVEKYGNFTECNVLVSLQNDL